MPAVLFFRTGNGPNATDSRYVRSLHRVCDLRRRFDLHSGRDLHRGWGLRYGTTWVIGAISILLKTTLECGLFCVKDIE